jgi:predicted ATPase
MIDNFLLANARNSPYFPSVGQGRGKRQYFHRRIGEVLEARFPQTVETQPELLAHPFTEAGLTETAVGYWLKAGQR